jgi:hypothetical protein
VHLFGYDPQPGNISWKELHSMSRMVLASGTDLSPCFQSCSSTCTQQYGISYSYHFDNASNHRIMGTLINPVSSKLLTYQEVRDGTATPLTERTTYNIPVRTTFNPTRPPPVGGASTIIGPDGSQTTIYSGAGP